MLIFSYCSLPDESAERAQAELVRLTDDRYSTTFLCPTGIFREVILGCSIVGIGLRVVLNTPRMVRLRLLLQLSVHAKFQGLLVNDFLRGCSNIAWLIDPLFRLALLTVVMPRWHRLGCGLDVS
jgi:hypothetical protein